MPTRYELGTDYTEKPLVFYFERSDGKRFKFDGISMSSVTYCKKEEEINIDEKDIISIMESE